MISLVKIKTKKLSDYQSFMPVQLEQQIKALAIALAGKKIVHVNATATPGGGGVAEILHTLIPLLRDAGIDASWYALKPNPEFFAITNTIHNSLQGDSEKLTQEEKDFFVEQSKLIAESLNSVAADLFIIHDPQPLVATTFLKKLTPAISRIHIDLSAPNNDTWNFLSPFFNRFIKIIVSMPAFANGNFPSQVVDVFAPAIDPLSLKNIPMQLEEANRIIAQLGLNVSKPIISQISRLDVFKDPIGVIDAYRTAKKAFPDLQLILLAHDLASDNPKAKEMLLLVQKHINNELGIFLFHDPTKINISNDDVVNAVQISSDIIIQKSVREGFGLTVTEAMWKNKAVIAGDVGGIALQITNNENGILVSSVKQCASQIIALLKNPSEQQRLGRAAHLSAKEKFLTPRLLRDHMEAYLQCLL